MAVLFYLLFADGKNKDGHFDNVYVGSGRFSLLGWRPRQLHASSTPLQRKGIMYEWREFKVLWEHERLTPEQAIGQLIGWGEQTYTIAFTLQRQHELLEQQVKNLAAQVATLQGQLVQLPKR